MQLGCIADDFTGATDVAAALTRRGLQTVVHVGVPAPGAEVEGAAAVIALKSRTAPPDRAIAESRAALNWLRQNGCRRIYFKYCSTFDSTADGNIGPVADVLLTSLNTPFTVACPAVPVNGRTVYRGHLFVGDALLHESPMRAHPLTPMEDSNLVRVLQRQTSAKVGLIGHDVVSAGVHAVGRAMAELRSDGVAIAVMDAIDDADLAVVGAACADLPLITGAAGLAENLVAVSGSLAADRHPTIGGSCAVVAGSASDATREQIRWMAARHPHFEVDATAGPAVIARALAWARPLLADGPVLIHAASERAAGPGVAAHLEETLATIARLLVDAGVRRLVVAGGETSGAVVQALGVQSLNIGPDISPGVPWTFALGEHHGLALTLKSGNFGSEDLFTRAFEVLS
jgi:3-dehydrotetronate 4-kinase